MLSHSPIHASDLAQRVQDKKEKLLNVAPPFPEKIANSAMGHPQWKSYIHSLLSYQKSFPGIYTPLDLIRWDKIPTEWLYPQIRKHGLTWERSQKKSMAADERRTEQTVLSRNSNEELYRKIMQLEKAQPTLYWIGSTRWILDSLSENERMSLTPLDPIFQKSDIGKEVFNRIRESVKNNNISGFVIDRKSQKLILETENSFYKIEFQESVDPQELIIRPYEGKDKRLGTDIKVRRENFRGYLYNASSGEKLPFGPIPLKSNQWVDERGHTHFEGDGHKH